MAGEIVARKQQELGNLGFAGLPAIISAAGERASFRFIEFFTANIRNTNTRVSYGRAVREFCQWCEDHSFHLEALNPVIVAGYVELVGRIIADRVLLTALPAPMARRRLRLPQPPTTPVPEPFPTHHTAR